jgi:UDP-glucose:(heptosyl)LPS alpha-1,3-glucosyltransferase
LTGIVYLKEKIRVIPNGVDTHRFRPDAEKKAALRERYGIHATEMVLVLVGNLFQAKGLDCILEAMGSLKGVKLFIIREDVHLPSYRKLVQESGLGNRVIFTGKVIAGIEDYYTAFDIFLLPSESEGFPLPVLEAAASGLPLLTTRVGGLSEFLEDGNNGYFIHRDPEDIARLVRQLVNVPLLKKSMGIAARKKAEEYSWDKVVQRTLEVYHKLMIV